MARGKKAVGSVCEEEREKTYAVEAVPAEEVPAERDHGITGRLQAYVAVELPVRLPRVRPALLGRGCRRCHVWKLGETIGLDELFS